MIKASALYLVIIIALVIGIICSSLIVTGYFYKTEYQKKFRYDLLENNVNSGVNILLASDDSTYSVEKIVSLFNKDNDSVALTRFPWGIYSIGISRAMIQKDTLTKIFSLANGIDSTKWAALYLMDEQRPFSLSGKTTIRGDAYIPQAGVKAAYVNNMGYQGDKRLILGNQHFSDKMLPPLNQGKLSDLEKLINQVHQGDSILSSTDTMQQSFLKKTVIINFGKRVKTISKIRIDGNIVLFSDTSLFVDSTATINNALIFARSITIKSGFKGRAQFFATDSIHIDSNCRFAYPSCAGILKFDTGKVFVQPQILIGTNTTFNGVIFTYDKTENPVKPLIIVAQNANVKGQIYSQGILELLDKSEVDGSIFTSQFLYKNGFTMYENYLINTTIDSKALTPYYLTSDLLPVAKNQTKILQWLEVK